MSKETSAGIVIFHESKFLLLHYPNGSRSKNEYWSFPKGHIEGNEKLEETAIRETKEETGLIVEILPGYKEKINYTFQHNGSLIFKTVYFFVAESDSNDVTISFEHQDYIWLSFEDAMNKLTYDNDKNVLKKAKEFLS